MTRIVDNYCKAALEAGYTAETLSEELSEYIHGIDIDAEEGEKCVSNVSEIAAGYGACNVNWDILCGDALDISKYDGKMDYVLGNPPYVRVHNLGESFNRIKDFSFAQNGMTDLFIVFFELGIKMMNKSGVLGYITPSSYFNSLAGFRMRQCIAQENLLKAVVDLKHFQAFSATTYTAITILSKNTDESSVDYYGFDAKNHIPYYIDTLCRDDYYFADNYYFAKKNELNLLKQVFFNSGTCDIAVKNGYATLCDKVFINDFSFESEHIIPVVKSSKGIKQKIFYPYDKNGTLISEDELKGDSALYGYLLERRESLVKRSNEKDREKYWYAFGRSQAINDTYKSKLTINTLIRNKDDL